MKVKKFINEDMNRILERNKCDNPLKFIDYINKIAKDELQSNYIKILFTYTESFENILLNLNECYKYFENCDENGNSYNVKYQNSYAKYQLNTSKLLMEMINVIKNNINIIYLLNSYQCRKNTAIEMYAENINLIMKDYK